MEGGAAATRLSDWGRNEQLYCSSEMTAIVRAQRAVGAYDREVQLIAQRALAPAGMKVADLSPSSRDDLLDGAARALVERERLYQLRLPDRLAPFTPNDPIFAQPSGAPTVPGDTPIGPTLGEAIDTYLATKQRSWTKKTHVIRVRYLTYLRQHFGDDHPLASIVARTSARTAMLSPGFARTAAWRFGRRLPRSRQRVRPTASATARSR